MTKGERNLNQVVHREIGGRDLDALAAFSEELFGWTSSSFDPDDRLVEVDEGPGGGLMRCRGDMVTAHRWAS